LKSSTKNQIEVQVLSVNKGAVTAIIKASDVMIAKQ